LAHNTSAPLRNEVVLNKVVMKMGFIRWIMTIAIIAVSIVMTVVILM
jgi:hypothetical protein